MSQGVVRQFGGGKARACMKCGATYYRRNREEVWVRTVRGTWVKIIANVCTGAKGCAKPAEGVTANEIRQYTPTWIR